MDIQVLASSSSGNCYCISDGSTPLLIEAGIQFKQIQQRLNFWLSEIAGLLVTQVVREEERTQVTTSPLEGVYMNVGLFTPWLVPLIFQS